MDILMLEERLRLAMLNADINELDTLISADLLFTNHLGQIISKEQDLRAHQSQVFQFTALDLSETVTLSLLENAVIVSTRADIKGTYDGQVANGNFRFTRVWSNGLQGWQVVSGHSCLIV